ncbi:MAG: DUF3330 domain-containing protein [Nitrosomonas sp.]|nr:MAG: DUF3330 domain-containing protein [Nitrosomonas sp.]
MNDKKNPCEPETIACSVCLKEIPVSEARSEEATDYVMYYCSLDCYDKWKNQSQESNP